MGNRLTYSRQASIHSEEGPMANFKEEDPAKAAHFCSLNDTEENEEKQKLWKSDMQLDRHRVYTELTDSR